MLPRVISIIYSLATIKKKWAHQNIAIGRKLLAYCYCHPTIIKWNFTTRILTFNLKTFQQKIID